MGCPHDDPPHGAPPWPPHRGGGGISLTRSWRSAWSTPQGWATVTWVLGIGRLAGTHRAARRNRGSCHRRRNACRARSVLEAALRRRSRRRRGRRCRSPAAERPFQGEALGRSVGDRVPVPGRRRQTGSKASDTVADAPAHRLVCERLTSTQSRVHNWRVGKKLIPQDWLTPPVADSNRTQ